MDKNKPQVAATGIAGVGAALIVWGWNVYMAGTDWVFNDPINGFAVAFVAFIIGPLIRLWGRMVP